MWDEVLEKLARLREMDSQCQAFGAEWHRYALRPRLSPSALGQVERRLRAPLPESLRTFYSEVGNGVAGPHYGLRPAHALRSYRAREPYPGAGGFWRPVTESEGPGGKTRRVQVSRREWVGILALVDGGCGSEIGLVASGPEPGAVVYLHPEDGLVETERTLVDVYHEWLDRELASFAAVESLMRAGATFEEIQERMRGQGVFDVGGLIASIAGVPLPRELFGAPGQRTYHGAVQLPWYEQVLREWQRENR